MTKRVLMTLLVGLLALPAFAQSSSDITQAKDWDADEATLQYCVSLGRKGAISGGTSRGGDYEPPRRSEFKVETVGEDDEIVSSVAASGALKYVQAGDIISFVLNGQRVERAIIDKADDDTITVSEAIDLGTDGVFYSFRQANCDDAAYAGEIFVRDLGLGFFMLSVQVAQMSVDTGGINVSIECRHKNGPYLVIEEKAITAGGTGVDSFLTRFFYAERWEACRVGAEVEDDDATDTDADAERINIWMSGDAGIVSQ